MSDSSITIHEHTGGMRILNEGNNVDMRDIYHEKKKKHYTTLINHLQHCVYLNSMYSQYDIGYKQIRWYNLVLICSMYCINLLSNL